MDKNDVVKKGVPFPRPAGAHIIFHDHVLDGFGVQDAFVDSDLDRRQGAEDDFIDFLRKLHKAGTRG